MYLDKDREIIKSSTYNIPERLKKIDPGYFIVRNHKSGNFEVHHSGQIGNTLAVTIPFPELDCRTLEYVKSTRIEYAEKIFKEIDEHNEKLEKESIEKVKDATSSVVKDIHRYVSTHESKDTIDNDSKLLKGVI